jgi:hypothetical protein
MNATDLMINDIVQFGEEQVKVMSFEYCGYCNSRIFVEYKDGSIYPTHHDNIKPIPLTKEILMNNGFSSNYAEDDLSYAESCGDIIGIHIYGKNGLMDEMYFKYVHQLQQALRLCGIEKTIEL